MRIFDGRYLVFAVALLAVWILGRSRNVDTPDSDATWSTIDVTTLDSACVDRCIEDDYVCEDSNQCKASSNLMDELADRVAPSDIVEFTNQPDLSDQRLPVLEPTLSEPTLSGTSSTEREEEVELALTVNDDVETFETTAPTKTAGDQSKLAKIRTLGQVNLESMLSSDHVGNQYASSELVDENSDAKVGTWKKNPFFNDRVVTQDDETSVSVPVPASFDRRADSILDDASFGPRKVSTPAIAVSQASLDQQDVTPTPILTDSVAQQAVHHIEYGKSLSRRGASYGARQEFFRALGVIASGNDVQTGSTAHATALRRAIRALREVQDFVVSDAENQIGMDLANILETHQTKIISAREASMMTPVQAMQRYFTFAHQQLDFAGGQNVVVAEAYFCLGKLHTVLAKHQPEVLDMAKAIVFHRAALSSDPQHYRSSNELGVLLARSGQLQEAEELVKQSLQIRPAAEVWQNLAKIHDRKGEVGLAQLAQTEFSIASQVDVAQSTSAQIRWLPQKVFNEVGPADFHDSTVASIPAAATATPPSRTAALDTDSGSEETEKKSFAERFNLKKWF